MDLSAFAAEVDVDGPVTIAGTSSRGGAVPGVRSVTAPAGIDWIQTDEMTVCCGAGTPVDELSAALVEHGQRVALPPGGTVGGALSLGHSGLRRLGDGPVRDTLLQARYVGSDGTVVKAGGPTVKNVSGFDVCRLLVGAQGTLGFLGEVILRSRPIAPHSAWFARETDSPMRVFRALHRPVAVLWDGRRVVALLEGHPLDVAERSAAAGLLEIDPSDVPTAPPGRHLVAPEAALSVTAPLAPGSYLVELGLGILHAAPDALPAAPVDAGVQAIARRVKERFDPAGRLNPGRVV